MEKKWNTIYRKKVSEQGIADYTTYIKGLGYNVVDRKNRIITVDENGKSYRDLVCSQTHRNPVPLGIGDIKDVDRIVVMKYEEKEPPFGPPKIYRPPISAVYISPKRDRTGWKRYWLKSAEDYEGYPLK